MKKFVKKIMFIIIIIICLVININIIYNFNIYTLRYGIRNISGKEVVSNKYYLISSEDIYNKEKYISAGKMDLFGINSKTVYIDLYGNEYSLKDKLESKQKNNLTEDNKYDISIIVEGEKVGLVDKSGNQILPCVFEDITIINKNFFIVSIDGELFLWNDDKDNLGKIIVTDLGKSNQIKLNKVNDLNFDRIMSIDDDFIIFGNKIAIKNNNKFIIFDERGRKINNSEYNEFSIISQANSKEEVAAVTKNGKQLLLDKNLHVIYKYDTYEVNKYNNGLLVVQNNGKQGVVKLDNKKIIELQYNDIIINNNYILASNDNKYYIFDYNGKLLFETNDILLTMSDGENFLYKEYDTILVMIYSSIMLISFIIRFMLSIFFIFIFQLKL